jgi:glycosyltransferase involved in cell wall biosynthesis
MRILVLTFYYKPDLSAGSFRATVLVRSLLEAAPAGSTIDVVTTLPNRYRSFSAEAPEVELDGAATVHRVSLPVHQSGMRDQSKAFITFARRALALTIGKRYDLVFATSSRLMTAALGALIAARVGGRLYLDIRDIFVDTIKDVAPRSFAWLIKPVFSLVERWTVGRASKVNLVSRGFGEYFTSRYPRQRFAYFTNGIDDEFIDVGSGTADEARLHRTNDAPMTVVYAGNLGEGQGLHTILPSLALLMGERVRFRIIGDGGRRAALTAALAAAGVSNVELAPPIARDELLAVYRHADVLFLHLNDHDAFRKVLPSKIFEYAAMGKPIWAGVSGYAAEFIASEVTNAAVFSPCDAIGAAVAFESLTLVDAPRTRFLERHARSRISREMAADVVDVGGEA